MLLIKPSYEILTPISRATILPLIELAGRTCYKSEDKITPASAGPFVEKICKTYKHESVIEHASFTVRFICDRGVSHELVRHRLSSFSQESTRYVNYGKRGMTFVIPPWVDLLPGEYTIPPCAAPGKVLDLSQHWMRDMLHAETQYNYYLSQGWSPQQARAVLPNSLKTEVVMTANLREWKHVLAMRTSDSAHPQMRELMVPLEAQLAAELPEVFGAAA